MPYPPAPPGTLPSLLAAAHQATGAQTVSAGSLLLQLVVGLGVILGIIALVSRLLRGRFTPGRAMARSKSALTVLGKQTLGKGVSVALVQVAGRAYVIGVTPHGVSRVGEIDPDELEEHHPAEPARRPFRLMSGPQLSSGEDTDPVLATTTSGKAPAPTWTSAIEHLRELTVRRA
jgi:flagellar biogenesis protein FliO